MLRAIKRNPDVAYSVLIPNERGLERALAGDFEFDEVNLFLSASETHNQQEREPLDRGVAVGAGAGDRAGARRRAALRGRDLGVVRLPLRGRRAARPRVRRSRGGSRRPAARRSRSATRPGMANPMQVRGFFERAREELPGVGADRALPQHARAGARERAGRARVGRSTRSRARSASSAAARCRAARPGNIATEDLVSMLHEMGVETGIDLERLLGCARRAQEVLGRPLSGHLLTAGPVDWHRA